MAKTLAAVVALDRKRALEAAVREMYPTATFDSTTYAIAYVCRYDVEIHVSGKMVFAEVLRDDTMAYSVRGSNTYFETLGDFMLYLQMKLV